MSFALLLLLHVGDLLEFLIFMSILRYLILFSRRWSVSYHQLHIHIISVKTFLAFIFCVVWMDEQMNRQSDLESGGVDWGYGF